MGIDVVLSKAKSASPSQGKPTVCRNFDNGFLMTFPISERDTKSVDLRTKAEFILDSLRRSLFLLQRKLFGNPPVGRILKDVFPRDQISSIGDSRPRLLFVYLARPFLLSQNHPLFAMHQNYRQSIQIAHSLADQGFRVDVLDFEDEQLPISEAYDVVLSHRLSMRKLEAAFSEKTKRIFFGSGFSPEAYERNLVERIAALEQRKGQAIHCSYRLNDRLKDPQPSDLLIGFGNEFNRKIWTESFPGEVELFANYAFPHLLEGETSPLSPGKDFLFLGNKKQIMKGLDLLLDVFRELPNTHLHICAQVAKEKEFAELYKKELTQTANIHYWGWVDHRSKKFRDIVSQCRFSLLPSCAEGSVGSALNAMATGLIPVLSQECGVDVEDAGFLLPDCRMDTIREHIEKLSSLTSAEIQLRRERLRVLVESRYSERAFLARWKTLAQRIWDFASKTQSS